MVGDDRILHPHGHQATEFHQCKWNCSNSVFLFKTRPSCWRAPCLATCVTRCAVKGSCYLSSCCLDQYGQFARTVPDTLRRLELIVGNADPGNTLKTKSKVCFPFIITYGLLRVHQAGHCMGGIPMPGSRGQEWKVGPQAVLRSNEHF